MSESFRQEKNPELDFVTKNEEMFVTRVAKGGAVHENEIEALALDALGLVRNELLVSLRFMSAAFARLAPLPIPGATLATDGAHLRFDPVTWARTYAADPAEASRAYLHTVLHCVFLHLYPGEGIDPDLWDIACDMVVESVIDQLDLPATRTAQAAASRPELERMAEEAPYSHKAHRAMDAADITQKDAPENAARAIGERFADTVQLDRSREQWENAALEMGIQLDAYAKLWGIEGSNLAMNLRKVTREKHDYRAFLCKFARMGEQIRVNDDEFDYVFYTYGLELYGNLPLVEPVEFAEEKRIRDFVIAIDTSASTKDGLVRRFIERTYSILADETSFFSRMNVLIVQCDAAITDVARITCLSDLEDYLENPTIKGLGGTDFRPVFNYVDEALATGELNDLGGLIYFTDGQGTYPTRRPAYETAFVFLDSDDAAASAPVPPWAMKVILDETFVLEEEPL